jgi:hypothetical protein
MEAIKKPTIEQLDAYYLGLPEVLPAVTLAVLQELQEQEQAAEPEAETDQTK